MSLFASKREKRLWFGVIAVLVAIYCTLGFAGKLEAYLRAYHLLAISFALGFFLVIIVIIGVGLKQPPNGVEIFVALGIAGGYWMVLTRAFINPIERTHLFEYGFLAVLIYLALSERKNNGRTVPIPEILAVVITALLGWLDEGLQWLLPNRVYDIRDVGFNTLAGLMAITAVVALRWRRKSLANRTQ